MSGTLYRKYRPQTFADVVGQEQVVTTLKHQLEGGRVAHAYLFCGMRGVGKTTVARLLAKALNCRQRARGAPEPCNACESCRAITAGLSLDVMEIDAASNRRIDDVRELREHIPYGPSGSGYKVVIIDEVHMLTTEAFNALLKTLEEPPAHVVFVLATTEVHKLPDTITSRCQRFDFRRLSVRDLVHRLTRLVEAESVTVDAPVLQEIAYLAEGSTRDAESYLGKLLSLGEPHITMDQASLVLPHSDRALAITFVQHLVRFQPSEAVALLNGFISEGGELSYFYRQVLELMRQMLLLKLGGGNANELSELEPTVRAELTGLTHELTHVRMQAMLERWLAAADTWRVAEVPQLPLELAAVAIACRPESTEQTNPSPIRTAAAAAPTKRSSASINEAKGTLNLSVVVEQWPQVVAKLRDYNHSLSFILSIAKPSAVEGNTVTVAFQYKLHHERLQDAKVIQAIEDALRDITGVPARVHAVLEPAAGGGDLLSSVLNTFGGRVVS